MSVYKCFFKITRRNLPMLIMYAVIFISITIALSNVAPGGTQTAFEDASVKLAVVDRDGSALSKALAAHLWKVHTPVTLKDDQEALRDALYHRQAEYILIVPEGYQDAVLRGDGMPLESAQVPGSSAGAYVDRQVQGYLATVGAYLAAGMPLEGALPAAEADLGRSVSISLVSEAVQEAMPGVYYFYKFLSYAFMMLMIFGLCPVLMVFGNRDLSMRMNGSALSLRGRNTGLALGALTLAGISFVVFMAFGFAMYGGDMVTGGGLLCMANALIYLLIASAMAFLIGQVSKSTNMISAIGNATVLALCFLGGVYVPITFMGAGMQAVSRFLPTYWYVQTIEVAMGNADGAGAVAGLGIQLAFAAALLSVGLVVTKQKQRVA